MTAQPHAQWFAGSALDGTYGYDTEALHRIEPVAPPVGFARTWRAWYDRALRVPAAPEITPPRRVGAHDVSIVSFTASDGMRLRAWLAQPTEGSARVGIVHSHGYGGREAPEFDRVPSDAAVIFPVARGLGALNEGIGAPAVKEQHILHGIGDVDTYILGRCAADLWSAGNALVAIAGSLPLYLVGESFGGGLGALALPWDGRFVGATLIVPTFGNYDIRLAIPCEGSGETVRRYYGRHPGVREVLRWFDASSAATFIRVPVRVEAALWDTYVPPPGQFAVANAIAQASRTHPRAELELEVLPAGHAEYPGLGDVRARCAADTRAHVARASREEARTAVG